MKILLTGGTGYIGSRVLQRLSAAGHDVTAIVRSEESAARLDPAAGAHPLVADLFDDQLLTGVFGDHDAVIHTAAGSDADDEAMNTAVIEAAERAFSGSGKHLILTGGIWTYGSSPTVDEQTPPAPPQVTAWRLAGESAVLAGDYHGNVIQPAIVYGYGTGLPSLVVAAAQNGTSIGEGTQHWTTVHVDDLADLYLLVLEKAPAHEAYVAASGDNPTTLELARAVNAEAGPGTAEAAIEQVGPLLAEALLLDQQADAAKAKALGWRPQRPTLTKLLAAGYPEDR
ncbi:NAD(P)H-binding protein [Nocardioides sp. BP30]|uniref:NAD-dependent epimerase/dehydratase family protein n=1 Tax=Nocardioides sp. BP30 TaxID=3036374 RepID=UPI0024696536|nr:NAD-dependent epimerase/dehydratase family protein [Nocardioides sp. BP30]WGL52116.1 NAD(P)H-binding protein [Nocardioides sp. BP30]